MYITREQAANYVTYTQMEELFVGISQLEMALEEKITGGVESAENSTPIWGDIAVISANYDESFFVRWECKDPRNRKIYFNISINDSDYYSIDPWYNGSNYTCFIPKGYAFVGTNTCKITATNNTYETAPKIFTVEIPQIHVPQAPTISQDIQPVTTTVGATVLLRYTASDDGTLMKHEFFNGSKLEDITSKVSSSGTNYEFAISWAYPITINECYFSVTDNEGLKKETNRFKVTVT